MTFGDLLPFSKCYNNDVNFNINDCLPNDNDICNLPKYTISEQAVGASHLNSFDLNCDINLSNLQGCSYYSCDDFHKLTSG